jgi:hypothetical protein
VFARYNRFRRQHPLAYWAIDIVVAVALTLGLWREVDHLVAVIIAVGFGVAFLLGLVGEFGLRRGSRRV